jgi:hypothetical protein
MPRNTHRCLLKVDLYEFTGEEIGKLRELYQHDRYLHKILPQYTFNEKFGNMLNADGYLQFVYEGDEKFLLFDLETNDELLGEEISNGGLDNLLKGIDIRPYLEKMMIKKYDDFKRSLTSAQYLIIELEYFGGGYYNEDDFDLNVSVVGALTGNNLTLVTEV